MYFNAFEWTSYFVLMNSFFLVASGQDNEIKKTLNFAALGDSITTGFNAEAPFDQKHLSWSTGRGIFKRVNSHYHRLKNYFPDKKIKSMNASSAGSTTKNLVQQAEAALQRFIPDYVTIMMGANDLCSLDESNYRDGIDAARKAYETVIRSFIKANHYVKILVSSLPNMLHLYDMGIKNNCQRTWRRFRLCPKLLSSEATMSERLNFHLNWKEFNLMLEEIADDNPENVKFVEEVMKYKFDKKQISWIDCFHPSRSGQNMISKVTWEQGFFKYD